MKHYRSKHCVTRAKQRGYKSGDAELVCQFGTDTGDGYVLTVEDRDEIISECKHLIERAQRLVGTFVCCSRDGAIKTIFHASRSQIKTQLGSR